MNLFLTSSIIIYIAKMWFACLIFRVMAHVLSTKFLDWTPLNAIYCDYLSHCSEKWFPKVNFQSLYRGFGFLLPHYWIYFCYLSPEGVVLNPEGFVLSPEGFVLPHFWDYLPPEGACLKHEMAKWRNGEMELKPRATVIKYDRSTEISICCRIYFVVNRHK